MIDHVAEQVPGPVRRDNRVEIGKAQRPPKNVEVLRETMETSSLKSSRTGRCARPAMKREFRVFTDFADQVKLPNPGCGHAQ